MPWCLMLCSLMLELVSQVSPHLLHLKPDLEFLLLCTYPPALSTSPSQQNHSSPGPQGDAPFKVKSHLMVWIHIRCRCLIGLGTGPCCSISSDYSPPGPVIWLVWFGYQRWEGIRHFSEHHTRLSLHGIYLKLEYEYVMEEDNRNPSQNWTNIASYISLFRLGHTRQSGLRTSYT